MYHVSERVTINPDVCNGKPTIRGMRISVQTILEFLNAGDSKAIILENYPVLEAEDIDACLQFAIKLMSNNYTLIPIAQSA